MYLYPQSAEAIRATQMKAAERIAKAYIDARLFYRTNLPNVREKPPAERLMDYLKMDFQQWELIASVSLAEVEYKVRDFAALLKQKGLAQSGPVPS